MYSKQYSHKRLSKLSKASQRIMRNAINRLWKESKKDTKILGLILGVSQRSAQRILVSWKIRKIDKTKRNKS